MDTDKICRCCLALDMPLLSIYDGGSAGMGCVADLLKQIAKLMPHPGDKMPEKACLQCISEINRCFVFKMKCENSNRTLRQLLPEAEPESLDFNTKRTSFIDASVQTDDKILVSSTVQTLEEDKPLKSHSSSQTEEEKPLTCHKEMQTEGQLKEFEKTGLIDEENLENFFIYDDPKIINKRFKRHSDSTSNGEIKKICLESDTVVTAAEIAEEEQQCSDQQPTAYILLEDSNCSQEQTAITSNSEENQKYTECEEYTYYENEEEEFQDEGNIILEEDYSNENFKTHSVYEIESSDGKTEEEAEATVKPKSNKCKPKGQYKCSQCIMTFVSMKVLKRHLAKRHDIKDVELVIDYLPPSESDQIVEENSSVDQINKSINSNVELTSENVAKPQLMHREKRTTQNEEVLTAVKYFCDNCQAGFAQRKTLTYHMKHKVCMTSSFKCNVCESIFVSEDNLKAHKLTHENPLHKCLECDTVCKTIEDLSQHMIDTHNRSARNQCHVCKKVFTMKTSLIDHLRIHSGEKPFLCTICGKSFRQNSNLRQHIIRHTNEKNFKCDMCPNAYVTKAELFSHKRIHTGEHPFKCDICQARFTTSCAVRKHARIHTGERPYACEYCPMRFAALNVLKNHRRIHTGEKPYKCAYCTKTFTQKGDCLIHERTHLNEKFKCFCKSSFMKKSNLTHHIKTRHPNYSQEEIKILLSKIENESLNSEDQIESMESIDNNFVAISEELASNNEDLVEIVVEDVG